MYRKLDADQRTKVDRITLGMTPGKQMEMVSESGLYKMIMRSDKPQAKPFQDWVTKVVLPAIRKDEMSNTPRPMRGVDGLDKQGLTTSAPLSPDCHCS